MSKVLRTVSLLFALVLISVGLDSAPSWQLFWVVAPLFVLCVLAALVIDLSAARQTDR